MIDGFMDEYGILVVMAIFAIAALWPVCFVIGVPLLVWSMLILIRSMLKGEKNE